MSPDWRIMTFYGLVGLLVECLFAYVCIAWFLGDAGWVVP